MVCNMIEFIGVKLSGAGNEYACTTDIICFFVHYLQIVGEYKVCDYDNYYKDV